MAADREVLRDVVRGSRSRSKVMMLMHFLQVFFLSPVSVSFHKILYKNQ